MNEQKASLHQSQRRNYLESLKILPVLKEEKTQAYLTLAFTFAALSIFGLFAINPTLTTIADLQKQLEDSKVVKENLDTKINNLYTLQNKYNLLLPDLPLVFAAVPNKPDPAPLLGKVQAISQESNINISLLQSFQVDLTKKAGATGKSSFTFNLEGLGDYSQLHDTIDKLTNFDRIVTFESVSIERNEDQTQGATGGLKANIQGRTYFNP